MLALPGIGRSTAGAVLSLGAAQRHAILDGNVKRVLARCFAVTGWPGHSRTLKKLWHLAEHCTPDQRVADYNQAMMDLGSLFVPVHSRNVQKCPLGKDLPSPCPDVKKAAYPAPKPRKTVPVRSTCMLIIKNRTGEIMLEQRPPSGIWGGLWSLPECPSENQAEQWCRDNLGTLWPINIKLACQRRHTFSHFPSGHYAIGNPSRAKRYGDGSRQPTLV